MNPEVAKEYRRITGEEPPKPFAERTHEERVQVWDAFLAAVNEADMDEAVDELYARASRAFTTVHNGAANAA